MKHLERFLNTIWDDISNNPWIDLIFGTLFIVSIPIIILTIMAWLLIISGVEKLPNTTDPFYYIIVAGAYLIWFWSTTIICDLVISFKRYIQKIWRVTK